MSGFLVHITYKTQVKREIIKVSGICLSKKVSLTVEKIIEKVSKYIKQENLPCNDKSLLVALSGGPDSVALLAIMTRLGYRVTAAHCNFHLRGEESMRDENFVRDFCQNSGITLIVKDFNIDEYRNLHHGQSVEMACRTLRYEWFESLRDEMCLDYIAVAHHADDNVETFLLNAMRGSGIAGLKAMRPLNGVIFRPLLCLTRNEIIKFLEDNKLNWVVDSTNAQNDFRRNVIRNIVISALDEAIDGARTGIAKTVRLTTAAFDLYNEFIEREKTQLITRKDDGSLAIDVHKTLCFENAGTLLFEILHSYGFSASQVADIMAATGSEDKKSRFFYADNHTLIYDNRGQLILSKATETARQSYSFVIKDYVQEKSPIPLNISKINSEIFNPHTTNGKTVIALGERWESHRLSIRPWQEGDRMKPFGLNGSKLLSDIYSDSNLSKLEKQRQWVLADDNGNVLWAIGYRSSELTRIKDNERFFLLTFQPTS